VHARGRRFFSLFTSCALQFLDLEKLRDRSRAIAKSGLRKAGPVSKPARDNPQPRAANIAGLLQTGCRHPVKQACMRNR